MLKRKVSCTFKRKFPLEIQERIYLLYGLAPENSAPRLGRCPMTL
jgi:hypothetical protein